MFKAITCQIILIISISANAFISFDTAIRGAAVLGGGIDSSIDLLESSSDLLGEISDESSEIGQFTNDIKAYNRNIKDLERDMRYLGYSEDEIGSNLKKVNSSKLSLEQKMRALTKSVKNIKKMKNLLSKLATMAAMNGGTGPDPSNQAILANQQQLLHLQIQQLKNGEMNELDEKMSDLAFKKSIAYELDQAKINLINSKENVQKKNIFTTSYQVQGLQRKAIQLSLCLCVLGCIGLMVTFFRPEGAAILKAGFFGVVLSYLIPSIVSLYTQWLGI